MDKNILKVQKKLRRARRTRSNILGTAEKPRLSVFRSLIHISCQLIDDVSQKTIISVSDKDFKGMKKTDKAIKVGELIAKKAQEKSIKKVVFDKGSYKYHGRVKALADAARKNGLEF